MADLFEAVEFLKREGPDLIVQFARRHRGTAYADLRFEVVHSLTSAADNGESRDASQSETAVFGVSVRFAHGAGAAGRSDGAIVGHGYRGAEVGRLALRPKKLAAAISRALLEAYECARLNAAEKVALLREQGERLAPVLIERLAEVAAVRDEVCAIYRRDPRALAPEELKNLCRDASAAVKGLGPEIAFNWVGATSELRDEVFISSEGALIDQAFAFSQGDCYVVAQTAGGGHQEIYDTIGQQRGLECLSEGWRGELMPNPNLRTFAMGLAQEARELAAAPILNPPDKEVTLVSDPHFNALLAHEIVGHPCEADRALKMEAAYAGRSWFLRSLQDNEIGREVAAPILSACSDPGLEGYGQYRYDHEGTPGRRVMHFERGVFCGFLNSRATAAVLGAEPNGSARASDPRYVPLIRMSNTFFMPGERHPEEIIAEVDRGYYVCGHRIPSIAESRENFRISARRVYEIEHGRLGRLFRSGSVISDSKRFFLNVDAAGNDLRLLAIPNCGKGQPMQAKRMSNGGPTLRSRARLAGG
ncbi:MAG: TldD/PmbA family protein [Candidatus Binataceae bacterium]